MIFYFSGTGNSLDAAVKTSGLINDFKLVSIAKSIPDSENARTFTFNLEKDEKVGFVFPVYAWGPPKPVLDFIDNLVLEGFSDNYIYAIATCGENIGNTMKVLDRHLRKKGHTLSSGFSVVMPNNYILASNVYGKEKEAKVISDSYEFLGKIATVINKSEKNVFMIVKGPVPFILTGLIHPAFTNAPNRAKAFYATDECNKCGICAKVCNCDNITLREKPIWGNNCTQCLACINYCPTKAIQYGKSTIKRGRYTNPNFKRNYL